MTFLGIEKAVVGGMSQGGFLLLMRAALAAPETNSTGEHLYCLILKLVYPMLKFSLNFVK